MCRILVQRDSSYIDSRAGSRAKCSCNSAPGSVPAVQLYSASMDSVIEVSVPLHLASIYLQSDLNARPLRRTLAPTTGNNVRSRSTRIFPMEEHIFPLIFDYLIFEERREKTKGKKVEWILCARNRGTFE